MKKNKNRYIDLSDIKDNDLDKTASFTDLMSRAEKKERERKKIEDETRELKEILMSDEEKKELKKQERKEKKEKKKNSKEEKNSTPLKYTESQESNLSKTQKIIDLTNEIKLSMLNNVDDNIIEGTKKKKFGIGNIIVTDFLIILSLAYYIYTIIFTNVQTNQLYLLIGGSIILFMILLFCISIISKRTISKVFSILNYLVFISYVLFNLILVLGIIKI